MAASPKTALVLLHGWGLNRRIWSVPGAGRINLCKSLSEDFAIYPLDLPGYGADVDYEGDYQIESISQRLLERAPSQAIWVGWSLGASLALHCASLEPQRFVGLQLISPTPSFMQAEGWSFGTSQNSLLELKQRFETGYQRGLKYFLMLQTSDRALVRRAQEVLGGMPEPRRDILMASLDLLTDTDLRTRVAQIQLTHQIIAGEQDRVVLPDASVQLHKLMSRRNETAPQNCNQLVRLNGGHLCFLESPLDYLKALKQFSGGVGSLGESQK